MSIVPPPGSYDSEKAFERLINKGKIENISIMSSQQKQHDLYNSNHLKLIYKSQKLFLDRVNMIPLLLKSKFNSKAHLRLLL